MNRAKMIFASFKKGVLSHLRRHAKPNSTPGLTFRELCFPKEDTRIVGNW